MPLPVRYLHAWLAALVLFVWAPAHAQQSLESGTISGRVVDDTGAGIPGADISALHAATGVKMIARTDGAGRFRVPLLRVGTYQLTAQHAGFREWSRTVDVNAGAAFELTITLAVGGIATQLTVTAAPPVIESARSQIASTIATSEIESLPMDGRNFLELALLAPGVSPTNVNSSQLFPETSAVPGISLSVNSQRNLSNNFIVDGLSANDDAAALSGITFGVDALEQVQVVTSGGQAELGRALGGYLNLVTKSGTNTRQGSLYYFGRDDRLNARNPLYPAKLPMHQHQYGGSAGGPIVANRTFYFGNVEQRRLRQSGLVTIASAAVDAVNARLAAVGYQGPAVATGAYPNPIDSTNLLAKATHAIGTRDQLAVRYSLYDVGAENARGAGGLTAPSASSGLDNRDQVGAVTNALSLGADTLLESRGQVARADLQALPADRVGPFVSIAGVASFGTLSSSPTGRVNSLLQLVNSLSHRVGAHTVRAGADFLYNRDHITFPRSARGSYSFASLASFLAGTYNNAGFTQTFGASEVSQTNPNAGVYIQDEWHVRPGLTLNLGVRYDLQFLETIDLDANNVSPRLGIAWAPDGSAATVVRASAGVFYDRVPLRAVANALLSAGNTTDLGQLRQVNVSLSPAQAAAPAFPGILDAAVPSQTLVNLTTMDRELENGYSRQGAVEVERQIGAAATISAGYQYARGLGLLMAINQNVPACAPSGTNNACRPNPQYANNNQYSAAGTSTYHGFHLSWLQKPTNWGSYRVSYTLSRSMNNVGEFFFSAPVDPFDLSKDWGRSDDDQRHRLVVTGSVNTSREPPATAWQRLTHGFQLSGLVQAYSALPFNITSGVTTIQGTAGRPVVDGAMIGRNAGIGTPFFTLNLRLQRTLTIGGRRAIDLLVEGFNLTNHRNVLTRNTTFGTGAYPANPQPLFGQVTAFADPRAFQFGLRAHF